MTNTAVTLGHRDNGEVRITINCMRQHNAVSGSVLITISVTVVIAICVKFKTRFIHLSDAQDGAELIYTSLRKSPEQIARIAVEEGVHACCA